MLKVGESEYNDSEQQVVEFVSLYGAASLLAGISRQWEGYLT